jgi:hypothetical protein
MSLNDLPGAEIILPGLSDLHSGESHTIGALLMPVSKTNERMLITTTMLY